MSVEYRDDDELINDAMEEEPMEGGFEAFSSHFDEAILEEMEKQQQLADAANEAATIPKVSTSTETTPDIEPEPPVPASSVPLEEVITHTQSWEESPKKTDLYKFERYQGTNGWRKKPKTSADTMVAQNWRRHNIVCSSKSTDSSATNKKNAASSTKPLVSLLHRDASSTVSIRKSELKRLVPKEGVDSVPVTLADGTRIHVPQKKSDGSRENVMGDSLKGGRMLGVSMAELIRRSDAITRKAIHRKRLQQASDANSNKDAQESESESMQVEEKTTEPTDHQLWVDKHAPAVFSHLLSDERTNREVLRALRAWDPYVFHKEPPPRPPIVQHHHQQQAGIQKNSSQQKASENGDAPTNPRDKRPEVSERVILLSGPPGVGKTTLAHIVASHAGYRPLEVNSSDERSASVLKERVVRSMESATLSVTTNKRDDMAGRPNCLILDEIDGADAKSAVSTIVDIIKADMPTSKKTKGQTYLRRPIIFICNHKYAPALRPLLPYAKQFDVGPPPATRLVARLRSVLSDESLSLMGGGALLHQLVAGSGGDIRSCLFTLQFASARAREVGKMIKSRDIGRDSSVVDISQALRMALGDKGNGLKDERNDVAGTMTAVFRKLKNLKLHDNIPVPKEKAGVDHILRSVENFGDTSKTLDCLFTNVLRVSYVDPTMDKCFAAHEWLSSGDIYRSHKTSIASNNQMDHFTMQRYHIPATAAAVHLLCRVETKSDLTFSTRELIDSRYQLDSNVGLVHKFVEGLAPKSRAGAVGKNVVTETIPYALWMLSAGEGSCSLNRAVSSLAILSASERVAFEMHVSTLRALGLIYVAAEKPSNQGFDATTNAMASMRLEPEIDRIVQFEELSKSKRRKEIPSTLKELLAHSATLEGMREREAVAETTKQQQGTGANARATAKSHDSMVDSEQTDKSGSPGEESPSTKHKMPESKATDPPAKRPKTASLGSNFLGIGAAKAKAAKTARKAKQVGFDRSKKIKLSNTGSGVEFQKVVRFKFSRGFTQAVRTPCHLDDLA